MYETTKETKGEKEKEKKGKERCGEQGGTEENRDEMLAGSANSDCVCTMRGRSKREMIVKQRVMGAYLYGEEKAVRLRKR